VGRVSAEKGIGTLLAAWQRRQFPVPLKIAGSGPLMPDAHSDDRGVEWLGHQSRAEVLQLMKGAACVVVPSECYETSPLALIEAFACGVPVIASRLGAMAEMVAHRSTGLLFEAGNVDELARTLQDALASPALMEEMAARGRREFERRYTADIHYDGLVRIYGEAIHGRKVSGTGETVRGDVGGRHRTRSGAATLGAGSSAR
jgi:glycosyltransferase involved in cell wall biosynthesis